MTEFKYIKFYSPWLTLEKKRRIDSFWILIIKFIDWFFIPKENPDFDKQFENVAEWLIEIDTQRNKPNREIGIDIIGQTILKGPWLDNKGFWHSGLFERFDPVPIDKSTFEKRWNSFVEIHSKNKGST